MNQNNKNRSYLIKNTHQNFEAVLETAAPSAKRAKRLTIKSGKTQVTLNGNQINRLKHVFAKEFALNSES